MLMFSTAAIHLACAHKLLEVALCGCIEHTAHCTIQLLKVNGLGIVSPSRVYLPVLLACLHVTETVSSLWLNT